MTYRQALALATLLDEVNTRAPNRSTASDGWIGDAAHASRTSDHNPWVDDGVVTARDFTDDPAGGHNATEFAEFLRTDRDPRIKYVIDQGRMFSSYAASGYEPWQWRPYSGPNAHTQHTHVSVHPYKNLYDSTMPWGWANQEDADMPLNDDDKAWIAKQINDAIDTLPNRLMLHKLRSGDAIGTVLRAVDYRTERLIAITRAIGSGDGADAQQIADATVAALAKELND